MTAGLAARGAAAAAAWGDGRAGSHAAASTSLRRPSQHQALRRTERHDAALLRRRGRLAARASGEAARGANRRVAPSRLISGPAGDAGDALVASASSTGGATTQARAVTTFELARPGGAGVAGVAASPGGRRVLEFVSAWDALAPRLGAASGGAGGDALRLLLEALKLAVPALQAAEGGTPCGRPRAARALAVAALLADLGADAATVAAALLAEAVEADALPLERVSAALGPAVGALVHDVARVRALPAASRAGGAFDDADAARLRTFCLAFHDVRAVLVELAARADALRHAEALPPFARSQLALETMQLYAPMAHAMAQRARDLRFELEDRAFAILFPRSYAAVADWLAAVLPAGEAALGAARTQLESALGADESLRSLLGLGGRAEVRARVKSRYSTMRKLLRDGRGRSAVHDLLGLRVVLHAAPGAPQGAGPAACYRAQAVAHALWAPRPGRTKDYIAAPKANGYASLHSTLSLAAGGAASPVPDVELQVRSADMEAAAEAGAAAHTAYKGGVAEPGAAEQLHLLLAAAEEVAAERFERFQPALGDAAAAVVDVAVATPASAPASAAAASASVPRDDDAVGAAVFAAFDKDGDGAITLAELAAVVGELGGGSDGDGGVAAAAAELMALADADASGTVTAAEFGALRRRVAMLAAMPAQDARTQRHLADTLAEGGSSADAVHDAVVVEELAAPAAEPLVLPAPSGNGHATHAVDVVASAAAAAAPSPLPVVLGGAEMVEERAASRARAMAAVDALCGTGDLYSAREMLRGITAADPSFSAAWTRWAGLEAEAGRRSAARQLHDTAAVWARAPEERARALLRGALFAAEDGRASDARAGFRRAVAAAQRAGADADADAGAVPVLHAWARFELRRGDAAAARRLLDAAAAAAPQQVYVLLARGVLEVSARRWAAARRCFSAGLAVEPHNTRLLQAWGRMEARLGDLAAARALFARGLAANHRNTYVLQAWALAELRAGCHQAARSLLAYGTTVDPGCAPMWSAQAQLEEAEGDADAARAAYAAGLEANPSNVPLLHAAARLERTAGALPAARLLLRRALAAEPTSPPVLRELAAVETAVGNADAAQALLARADEAWAAGAGARGARTGGGRKPRWRTGMEGGDAEAADAQRHD